MDHDVIFVTGLVGLILGIAALVSALSDRRWPYVALVCFVVGGGAVFYAMQENPDRYTRAQMGEVIFGVIARIIN